MTTKAPQIATDGTTPDEATMTVEQVAAAVHVKPAVIYAQISDGELIGRRIGGRRIVVLRSDFNAWLESRPIVGGAA
jgi:excisionase family DNA binding protein